MVGAERGLRVADQFYLIAHDDRPPADVAAHLVLSSIMASPHRDVSVWLAYLAESLAVHVVTDRLIAAGVLVTLRHRRLLGTRTEHVLLDATAAPWQSVRLANALDARQRLWAADALLAGLVNATGLTPHVLWDRKASTIGLDYLPRVVATLPPSLHNLVAHVEAAVGRLVLAPR
jgi:hypothetical protein